MFAFPRSVNAALSMVTSEWSSSKFNHAPLGFSNALLRATDSASAPGAEYAVDSGVILYPGHS